MPVDVIKLTSLFDDKRFCGWLHVHFPDDLEIIYHARKMNLPQPAIQARVITLYNKIHQSDLFGEFRKFITLNYPHIVADEEVPLTARLMIPASPDPNRIFSSYHPNLLRFPMQIMFKSDSAAELKQVVEMFASRFRHTSKSLIVGNIGYVEYIPPNLARYRDKIPDTNWEIAASRK